VGRERPSPLSLGFIYRGVGRMYLPPHLFLVHEFTQRPSDLLGTRPFYMEGVGIDAPTPIVAP
jgi:hypothetical protein